MNSTKAANMRSMYYIKRQIQGRTEQEIEATVKVYFSNII
jgi:hypothetical protein